MSVLRSSGGRSFASTALAIVVTSLALGVAPIVNASAVQSFQSPTNLYVTESNGTVTASWSGALGVAARTPKAQPHGSYYVQFGYTCTLLYAFGGSTSFSMQTSGNTCSFSGLNPSIEYGVMLQTREMTGEGMVYSPFSQSAFPSNFTPPTTTTVKPRPQVKHTLVCVKGTSVRRVVAVHPVCPVGYSVRH